MTDVSSTNPTVGPSSDMLGPMVSDLLDRSGPRAVAIFVGSTSLHGALAVAFTSGLHAAFYASMGFMALAAALSALRAGSTR